MTKETDIQLQFQIKADDVQAGIKTIGTLLEQLKKQAKDAEASLATMDKVSAEKKKADILALKGLISAFEQKTKDAASQLEKLGKTEPGKALAGVKELVKGIKDVTDSATAATHDIQELGTLAAQSAAKAQEAQLEQVSALEDALRDSKKELADYRTILSQMSLVSGLLFAPAVLSANEYTQAVGRTEGVSRRFLAAQTRMTRAQQDFGRKATEALTPYYEMLADINELINKVPDEVIQAGVAAGAALALVGVLGTLVSQITTFTSVAALLIARLNANASIAAMGGVGAIAGNVAGLAAAGAIGTGLGIGAVRGIGEYTGNERLKEYGLDDAFRHLKSVLGLAGGLLIEALGGMAKGVIDIAESLATAPIRLGEAFDQLVNSIEKAALDLALAIANTEIAGKPISEILGFGDKTQDLQSRRDLLDQGTPAERERQRRRREMLEANTNLALVGEAPAYSQEDLDNSQLDPRLQEARDFFDNIRGEVDDAMGAAAEVLVNFLGFVEDSANSASNAVDEFGQEALDAVDQFNQDMAALETAALEQRRESEARYQEEVAALTENYHEQRLAAQAQFEKQSKQAAEQYQKQVLKIQEQAVEAAAEAEAAYQETRAETIAQFQEEEQKRLVVYNRERERAEAQARRDLIDAASKLDARAVLDILSGRDLDRKTAKEDFDFETQERAKDQEQQLADLQENHEEQREARLEALSEQLADAQENYREQKREREAAFREQRAADETAFNKQLAQRAKAHQKELFDLAKQAEKARQEREKAFKKQINQLLGYQEFEAGARAEHYRRLAAQLNAYIAANNLSAPRQRQGDTANYVAPQPGSRQTHSIQRFDTGGYPSRTGMIHARDDEFISSPGTTRSLERMAGGRLTQQSLLQLVAGAGGGMGDIHIAINGAGDPLAVAGAIKRELQTFLTTMKGSRR